MSLDDESVITVVLRTAGPWDGSSTLDDASADGRLVSCSGQRPRLRKQAYCGGIISLLYLAFLSLWQRLKED